MSPTGPAWGCSRRWLYQMDRDIPSMLLVTGGYGNIKNNEKGRLSGKLLGKLGLFVKLIFFLILIFF